MMEKWKGIGVSEGLIFATLLNTFIIDIFACLEKFLFFFNYADNSKQYLSEKNIRSINGILFVL